MTHSLAALPQAERAALAAEREATHQRWIVSRNEASRLLAKRNQPGWRIWVERQIAGHACEVLIRQMLNAAMGGQMSAAEETLALHFRAHGLAPEREYRFGAIAAGGEGKGLRARLKAAGLSDWRADFAFLEQRLLIEVEGGGWTGGRHTRGNGFEADLLKYGEAMRLGWSVYRCSPAMVASGRAIKTILILLKVTGE